jgi:hypothetical protein
MNDPLQVVGASFAMVGATLIATKVSVYAGFWLFLISSSLLAVWAVQRRYRPLFFMQLVFWLINLVGIIQWSPR